MSDPRDQPATRGDVEDAIAASEARTLAAIAASEMRIITEAARMTTTAIAASEARMIVEIASAASHTANVVIEHNREVFPLATDQTKAVDQKVDAHVADDARHRVTRRRR